MVRSGLPKRIVASPKIAGNKTKSSRPLPKHPRGGGGEGERLQKILAAAGIASRRACEQIILDGRVQVNGETVTKLGTRANPEQDLITLDFHPIHREKLVYILLNKPKGYVTTVKDDKGRPTVMALLNGISARVYPVGRLDFNSEGLLLLTNDGTLAKQLMSPGSNIPKIYLVKVHKMPPPEALNEFRSGFKLDGRRLKPCQIEIVDKQGNPWLRITLLEGKNQQIRKMFAAIGHPVHKLRRVQIGPIHDSALKPGEWRFLAPSEVIALKNMNY
jgi:pseudouridine synthase